MLGRFDEIYELFCFHWCKEYRYDFRLVSHGPLAGWATSVPATDTQAAWQDMHSCDVADIFPPSCLHLPAKLTESQFDSRTSVACMNTVLRLCYFSGPETRTYRSHWQKEPLVDHSSYLVSCLKGCRRPSGLAAVSGYGVVCVKAVLNMHGLRSEIW